MIRRPSSLASSIGLAAALFSSQASAISVDGHGYYSLRGETRTNPEYQPGSSAHQAVDQFFRLDTELRVNDQSSVFLEFKLFDDERNSFMGDSTAPQPCPTGAANANDPNCQITAQSSAEPRYEPYVPKVTKAYARYSMDYCLLTIGRRGRNWGMGIFLDDGTKPFSTDASIFDGVTCDINIQKSQTLGFSVGYDKISETGGSILADGLATGTYGPTNNGDDLDQFFFTIEYNDHRANVGKGFSKQIGIYFANIVGGDDTKTDLKFGDLYLNFVMNDLVFQNEILFRLGRSADPNWSRLGAARSRDKDDKIDSELQGIAIAGSLEYFLSRSGAYVGPKEYNQGNATSHSLFVGYAFAPGDADGYYPEYESAESATKRDKKVTAIALHQNFKPGLLLFNGRKRSDTLRVDGAFDPYRVVNATVFHAGYRYKSVENGSFEAKLVTAKLNESMPAELKVAGNETVGYYDDSLGFELDLSYSRFINRDFEFGLAGAIGIAGDAWKTQADKSPENSYLLQSYATFHF
jgi:hypothetical protein